MSFSPEEINKLHGVADSMLPAAKAFAKRVGNVDPVIVEDLMLKAIDKVMSLKEKSFDEIDNLPGYVYTVYRRLFIDWYNKQARVQSIESITELPAAPSFEDIEKRILLAEIIKMMNEQERFIYHYLVLGCSYNEIADKYGKTFHQKILANALRSKFSKAIQKIAKKIAED